MVILLEFNNKLYILQKDNLKENNKKAQQYIEGRNNIFNHKKLQIWIAILEFVLN